jgi:hypothetical protein
MREVRAITAACNKALQRHDDDESKRLPNKFYKRMNIGFEGSGCDFKV